MCPTHPDVERVDPSASGHTSTRGALGGQARNGLAALNTITGQATNWNPGLDFSPYGRGHVAALAVSGQTVYAGGEFSSIGGRPRDYLAALDAGTGMATDWNPSLTSDQGNLGVYSLALSGSTVYAGGYFTSVDGQPRNGLGAINTTTGQPTSWNPDPQGGYLGVHALTTSHQAVYVGGGFESIGGKQRHHIAAIDAATGQATSWNPGASLSPARNARVYALAAPGGTVYVGGSFNAIGGQERRRIAAIDADTGRATNWKPYANGAVTTLVVGPDGSLWAGGGFTGFPGTRGANQSGIARFAPK